MIADPWTVTRCRQFGHFQVLGSDCARLFLADAGTAVEGCEGALDSGSVVRRPMFLSGLGECLQSAQTPSLTLKPLIGFFVLHLEQNCVSKLFTKFFFRR